ncbi:MAG: histidinol-phosphatase HisJ family protein [Muribaculaceae bacterium]|nr:histidinol-phosphatase HisJ family protein [Muribaculaceae bacterium]
MDFRKIISSTRCYNFHSHTQFCDGRATMEEMARAAVSCGMIHYGFTPHSPIPIESPCNMKASDVEIFLAEVSRLQNMSEFSTCRFYRAMEIDYLSPQWGPANDYFRSLDLDYSIGSVHFIPSQTGEPVDIDGNFENFSRRMKRYFRGDIDYVVDTFFRQSSEMIKAGGFDIIGHFDKIGQNASYYSPGIEDGMHYHALADSMVEMIIDRDLIVELNTKAKSAHGRFFPAERYLRKLVDADITILVNSDAHYPDTVNALRDEALHLLDALKCVS